MSDIRDSDWEQPDLPVPRPDPIRPGPRNVQRAEMVALRDYMEFKVAAIDEKAIMRVESLAKELAVALRMSELAINKADTATSKRFEEVNEFRKTLSDQAAQFATRSTVDAMEKNILDKIDSLHKWHAAEMASIRSTMEAKVDAQWKVLLGFAGAIAAIQATIAFLT